MKATHSLENIKGITTSLLNNNTVVHDNRLDDISVHLAASKYSTKIDRRSELYKSLSDTLYNKDALGYFLQYLDSKGRANIVNFWIDVHSFKTCFMALISPNKSLSCDRISENLDQPIENDLPEATNSTYSSNMNGQQYDTGESIWKDIEHDAMLIFTKYFSWESRHRLELPDEFRDSVAQKVCRCRDDRPEGISCFQECVDHVFAILEKEYYPLYLQSSYHCKHQLDILTGNALTINDIIYHGTSLSYFAEFMEQNWWMDYLQCFLDVDNFHQHFSSLGLNYDPLMAQEDAMIIYDKFFSLQALRPLNLSDGVRLEVESAICKEGGILPDCFILPRSLLLYKMEQEHFVKFLKSDLYYKYLVDLINTVHVSKDIPAYQRKTGSDAGSEKSFETTSSTSSKNTLLAINTLSKSSRKSKKSKVANDLQIDGSLLDPNNLWQRPNTSLKFGHVNTLGQFIPEFEPEPDHDKKKFGFSFLKRKTKADEDLAILVAQQILQDVNILTSRADDDDDDTTSTIT